MKKFLLLAVVFFLTVSSPAYAEIVYTGSIVTVPDAMGSGVLTIDIAGDTASSWDSFSVTLFDKSMGPPSDMSLEIYFGMGTGVVVDVLGSSLASNLTFGTPIGASSLFTYGNAILYEDPPLVTDNFDSTGGYIGLKMTPYTSPGVPYYGWLHMSGMSDIGLPTINATFDGWAYENTGAPINAGAVPIPGAFLLGSIGLGCAGWLCKRLR